MSTKPLLAAAIAFVLAACQPSPTQPDALHGVGSTPRASERRSEQAEPAFAVPRPVEAFEMYCYRTNAEYQRIMGIAELMELPEVPEKFQALIGPMVGSGKAYVIVNDREMRRMVLLGASDQGACGVFSMGYDETEIRGALIANYNLKVVARDETGLQISEMYIPNGIEGTVGEGNEHGVVGITTAKAGDGGISVSFVSPEAAKRTFDASP